MDKRFERTLSQILSIVVLIVFATTLVTVNMNVWVITYLWAVSFLIAWVLMLIFALHVLLQNKSYGLSIFVAIITALGFGILSVPAILVLARFIPQMPTGLSFGLGLLDQNSQLVLYTSLIIVYFAHLVNSISLRRKINEDEIATFTQSTVTKKELEVENDDEDSEIVTNKSEEYIKEDINSNELSTSDTNIDTSDEKIDLQSSNISSEDLKIGEKIVFESNIDEKVEYNIDNIKLVEDLTQEELEQMRKEENNG